MLFILLNNCVFKEKNIYLFSKKRTKRSVTFQSKSHTHKKYTRTHIFFYTSHADKNTGMLSLSTIYIERERYALMTYELMCVNILCYMTSYKITCCAVCM